LPVKQKPSLISSVDHTDYECLPENAAFETGPDLH
jgi:hypothetical protein